MQLHLQTFQFGTSTVELYVPDAIKVQEWFGEQLKSNPEIPTPYWSQVWPAAISICEFITHNTDYIKGKKVLELAAGLGLPSFLAAQFAKKVHCSDYVQEAVDVLIKSIQHNNLTNIHCSKMDWNALPHSLTADVLLLSDINYEPTAFEALFKVLQRFLEQGTTIILSTPQRMMAKPFIERLLPFCVQQEEIIVQENALTTVMVLKKDFM